MVYRADPAICNACPVKAKCTTSDRGRNIQRSIYEDYLEKVRGYHATEAYKKAIRKRQVWVEPLFAEAKEWHGLRRLRLRGLLNANIQGLLIAAGPEPEAVAGRDGLGTTTCPVWEPRGHSSRATRALGRLQVTISSARMSTNPVDRTSLRTYEQPCPRPFSTA